jgi:uncharacterized membrane protein YdbT with pleckstrin-like domain
MRYVERVLEPGERVVYETTLHYLIYFRAAVAALVCIALLIASAAITDRPSVILALEIAAALAALLALGAWLRAFIRRATTELAITDHRIIYKTGLLSRHTLEMNRGKVESVDVDQSLLGRVLNFGTIVVRGTGGSLEPIRNIADPLTFRSRITAVNPATVGDA